jgi:hypothetical protein
MRIETNKSTLQREVCFKTDDVQIHLFVINEENNVLKGTVEAHHP